MSRSAVENFDRKRFRKIREKAGLSIASLARRSRVSRGTISQWENGLAAPSVELLTIVCAELDIDPATVMNIIPSEVTLKDLRVIAGLSRSEVREHLGLSVSGWGDIERGDVGLSVDKINPLAELFGVDPDTVFTAAERTRFSNP